MKYVQKTFILLLSFVFIGQIPIQVSAQTTTIALINDNSNESSSSTTQRIKWYRRGTSEVTQKVALLPAYAETSIKMPVLFGVKVSDLSPDFGDPRSNGRTHLGQDIMAVKGTPVVSPTKAVVVKMGTGSGEGNYLYTANPGGETFVYMHLDKFGEGVVEGTALEQGSLIGYVGNTGNASGGAAHLHFEAHGADGVAMNPYLRLTSEFMLSEKITYLTNILSKSLDVNSLSQLLASSFKSTFTDAISQNIPIPESIRIMLPNVTIAQPQTTTTVNLPPGELALGSSGDDVVALQKSLIAKASGPLTTKLALAGATGYFGAITQNALIEYQTKMNIVPSNGYYDVRTKNTLLTSTITNQETLIISTQTPVTTSEKFLRNLSFGMTGNDVLLLQKFLNNNGFIIATTGPGSQGNETTYFGKATQQAVINFQMTNTISPAVGFVGPLSRAALNAKVQ